MKPGALLVRVGIRRLERICNLNVDVKTNDDVIKEIIRQIHDYLTDNEVEPIPVFRLTFALPVSIYFEQIIICSKFWKSEARLAVGSIIVGQPLRAQGADDVNFIYASHVPLGKHGNEELPVYYRPIGEMQEEYIALEIHGPWHGGDVNRPARSAQQRMARRELKLDDQFLHLYKFVREVASEGFGVSLNQIQQNEGIAPLALSDLHAAEHKLVSKAVDALNRFEGREEELSSSDRREQEQHRAWDEE